MSTKTILQWNCQRISDKISELCDVVDKQKPDIVCIQETMFSKNTHFTINKKTKKNRIFQNIRVKDT